MKKIIVLDGYTLNPGDLSWEGLSALGELTVYDRTPHNLVAERIADAHILLTNKTVLDRDTLKAAYNLEYIGVLATGYNVVDIKTAKELGIPVTNIPTYGTSAVAQYVFALLMEACHHVGHHGKAVADGRWSTNPDFCFWDYSLIELMGKTMGIIGFGRIGQRAAAIARAFGMKVIAYDERPKEEGKQYADYVDLDTLYAESDVISLHVPLFPSTEGMINAESIKKMKLTVIIINTSRGQLVNEADLAKALEQGGVYFYAADVVSEEPPRDTNPLLKAPNCIITPHIAWAPVESRGRLMAIAVDNLEGYLSGSAVNVVNP